MSLFKETHLRVLSPKTTDGTTPLLVNGRLDYKEDFLPLTAKAGLLEQNKILPEILRKIIEVVPGVDKKKVEPVVPASVSKTK